MAAHTGIQTSRPIRMTSPGSLGTVILDNHHLPATRPVQRLPALRVSMQSVIGAGSPGGVAPGSAALRVSKWLAEEGFSAWGQFPSEGDAINLDRFVVISGCSGGGKSTLLAELGQRGYTTVEEPGRRIVKAELLGDGRALPWVDEIAFARHAITFALTDLAEARVHGGWVFLDRGLIDAAAALQHLTGEPALITVLQRHRFHNRVFLAPPWPEIYRADPERRHSFDVAVAEYQRLLDVYPSIGYEVIILPKVSVSQRANFVLSRLP